MDVRDHPVEALNPAPYNPRKPLKPGMPGFEKLARSLGEFELVQPIVWNELTGHIVSGHQRVEILKHRGATHVPAVVVRLSLPREKALNVTLNNAEVGSTWDEVPLLDLLSELQQTPGFDATLTGFDERQLTDLVLAPAAPPAEPSSPAEPTPALVQVRFELPPDVWNELRPALDDLLAETDVRLHVSLPSHDGTARVERNRRR